MLLIINDLYTTTMEVNVCCHRCRHGSTVNAWASAVMLRTTCVNTVTRDLSAGYVVFSPSTVYYFIFVPYKRLSLEKYPIQICVSIDVNKP